MAEMKPPVKETTPFEAGSISKPIFALGVMRLVQERKLDLDKDPNEYLSSWKVPPMAPAPRHSPPIS